MTDSAEENRHWGNMLYESRTKNLSEIKARMWTVLQWAVGLNLAASASALSDEFQLHKAEIGIGVILFSVVSAVFIVYLHCGAIRQRRKLERMKTHLGEKSAEFRALEGKPEESRLSRWKDWPIGAFQIVLIASTGLAAALISFENDLTLFCLVLLAITTALLAFAASSIIVALFRIPDYRAKKQ